MLDIEKLKHLRLVFNLSQDELAARLGVSKPYVSMIENRKQALSENSYQKWVDALYGQYDVRENNKNKGDNDNGK